jgi:hypothetical protein
MISVYVAAASAEVERAERVMSMLRERGCSIVGDWTDDVRDQRRRALTDADLTDADARAASDRCLDAIDACDVLLYLAPAQPSTGASAELGYALHPMTGARVVVAGPHARSSIFSRRADIRAASDEIAVSAIAVLAAGHAIVETDIVEVAP